MHVLIVEDNELVSTLVRAALEQAGWSVAVAGSLHTASLALHTQPPDAVVLDIELPDGSGYDLLERLRGRSNYIPVVMLTARGGPTAAMAGLVAGADDYVAKPFDVDELVARLKAVMRLWRAGRQLVVGDLALDRQTREVDCRGVRLRLTPREQALLEQLAQRGGEPVTRDELLRTVWRIDFDPGSNVVETNLARLRAKLRKCGSEVEIITVRGRGYALQAGAAIGKEGW